MENKIAFLLAFAITFMTIVLDTFPASGDITCQEALMDVTPCGTFVGRFGSETPSSACCEGVQKVNSEAATPEIRRSLCECLKSSLSSAILLVDPEKIKKLPQLCNVSVSVPLDPSIDCSKISF